MFYSLAQCVHTPSHPHIQVIQHRHPLSHTLLPHLLAFTLSGPTIAIENKMKVEARIRQLEGGAKVTAASKTSSTGKKRNHFCFGETTLILWEPLCLSHSCDHIHPLTDIQRYTYTVSQHIYSDIAPNIPAISFSFTFSPSHLPITHIHMCTS